MPLAPGAFAGLNHVASGKVREIYDVPGHPDQLVMIATDRISAFDVVMPTEIPDKGAVLTGISMWWFEQLASVVANHIVSTRVPDYPEVLAPYAQQLQGRSMLCRRLDMVLVECVVRGFLTGSGLKDYERTGAVSGHELPPGLVDGSRLPAVIYTPSTKAPLGEHDENITRAEAAEKVGPELAAELERLTIAIYSSAAATAESRGIILADTKVEFGHDADGVLRLGDEVLTPDSSRFWPRATYAPGQAQDSFDKQYVRDWLIASGNKGKAVELPEEVVAQTRDRYIEAYETLTGSSFDSWLRG
jgi:phosphoribosylaminoimidazole-succinocarboxamide synthase